MPTLRSPEVLERSDVGLRSPAPAPTAREPWFDNIKMVLVALVVAGHAWALMPHQPGADAAYNFVYAWHMPAFAIVTGYLSRNFTWRRDRLIALVTSVAVPYVIFEAALTYYQQWIGGAEVQDLFSQPHWVMWYLAALFFWRLSVPLFTLPPAPVALAAAISLSLLSGFWDTDYPVARRILGFLPFFVLGVLAETRHWRALRSSRLVPWAAAALVGLIVAASLSTSWVNADWYYYSKTYDEIGVSGPLGIALRSSALLLGLFASLCVFAVVPRGRSWLSRFGTASLVVYLFHGFVILTARYNGYPEWAAQRPVIGFLVTTVAALGLAVLLASPAVATRLNRLADPVAWWKTRTRTPAPTSA